MPNGYRGEGRTFSKKQGKWIKTEKEKVFDYETLTEEQRRSAGLIISFFRWYPDYFYDMIRSDDAPYALELVQRMILRAFARYRYVYITGARGLTKTFCVNLSKAHDGVFFPGEKVRYNAPAQKQSAALASAAFKNAVENYPLIGEWWKVNNDRADMFRITTIYGSEFTMYAPRGDNCHAIVGEEIAQEENGGFDFEEFDNISKTCRLVRKVNGEKDPYHINMKECYISNASTRQNKAFTVYRQNALNEMLFGEEYAGFCMDISWKSALLCELRDIEYYQKERKKTSPENWMREMEVQYTGTGENPLLDDATLSKSKTLKVMEDRHCKDMDAIYIVSHDVSYAGGSRNAQCADVVLKLTRYKDERKRDIYRKQAVYVDSYQPQATYYEQAEHLRALWERYCLDGANTTYLVIDANSNGDCVLQELMKPRKDGKPPLCCMNHQKHQEIEQPNALPVIYPMQAGTRGTKDEDGAMIQYAQSAFEHGNVELLTTNILDGIDAYKIYHNIKDNSADRRIKIPYDKTDLLCRQIANLKAVVSGLTLKEQRKSMSMQRDIWSALKYALRLAQILEAELTKEQYRVKSSWSEAIKNFENDGFSPKVANKNNIRSTLLASRRR